MKPSGWVTGGQRRWEQAGRGCKRPATDSQLSPFRVLWPHTTCMNPRSQRSAYGEEQDVPTGLWDLATGSNLGIFRARRCFWVFIAPNCLWYLINLSIGKIVFVGNKVVGSTDCREYNCPSLELTPKRNKETRKEANRPAKAEISAPSCSPC